MREPTIACWPGQIPAGSQSSQLAATIDILPTVAYLAGAELPERKIDGLNIWPLLAGDDQQTTPHDAYYYYWGKELHAVRSGPWKLHFPHEYRTLVKPGNSGQPGPYKQVKCELELYNLDNDIGEQQMLLSRTRKLSRS